MRPAYPLKTRRLELRPFEDGDLDDLFSFYALPEVARYLYWEPRTLGETRERLEQLQALTSLAVEGSSLALAVVLLEASRVIGQVTLALRSREHRQGELGYVFNPAYGGQGYATEAAAEMLTLGFETFGLHRIYGRCDVRNHASYRLMERLGMRREAHLRENEWFKGEWGDEFVYAILEDEWRTERSQR